MQAASWLGVSNPEELLRTEGTGFAAPRPEGLGLGAKFLPHHKVRGQPQMTFAKPAGRNGSASLLAGKSSYCPSGEEARQEVAPAGGWGQGGRHWNLPAQESLEQSITPVLAHSRSPMCSSCCKTLTLLLVVAACKQSRHA